MSKEEYLKMAGYSSDEWTVLSPEEAKVYLDYPGRINNMYEIKTRKAIEGLGAGCYLTNIKWMEKNYKEVSIQDASPEMKEAVELVNQEIPSSVPKPPPIPSVPVDDTEEVEEESCGTSCSAEPEFECEQFNQTNVACEKECDSCKPLEEILPKESEDELVLRRRTESRLEQIKKIDAYRTESDGSLTCSSGIKINKNIIEKVSDEEFAEYMVTLQRSVDRKQKEVNPNQVKADEMKAKIVEKSGIPEDNIVVASVPKPEKEVVVNTKTEEVKVITKEPIVQGEDKLVKQFDFLDQIIDIATEFKKTMYAITLIKNTIDAKDLTPAKKLVLIEKAIQNIK